MMSLCKIMQLDFTDGTGRYDDDGSEMYSDSDLAFGIDYAEGWLAQGYTYDKIGRFDLVRFRDWCESQLGINWRR